VNLITTNTHISQPQHNTISNNNNNAPKYGTRVPNRIFVGGISGSTTETELAQLFSGIVYFHFCYFNVFLYFLTLECETTMFSENVWNWLPSDVVLYCRKRATSTILLHKPKNLHSVDIFQPTVSW
jgi:hypothetical protein